MKNKYEIRGETTAIFLNRKDGTVLETLIDTDYLEKAKKFPNTWVAQYSPFTKTFYAKGTLNYGSKRKVVLLHRFLLEIEDGLVPDHINRDSLDNRRGNLRVVTQAVNLQNKSTKGFRGVYHNKTNNRWVAFGRKDGKQIYLGIFSRELEAAKSAADFRKSNNIFTYDSNLEDLDLDSFSEISVDRRKNKHKGYSISWHKNKLKWQLRMVINGKQRHIGMYEKYEEALKRAEEVSIRGENT